MALNKTKPARFRYVYFARSATGLIKIGRCVDPYLRVASLRYTYPHHAPFALLWSIDTNDAVSLERYLHHIFEDECVSGELFRIPAGDLRLREFCATTYLTAPPRNGDPRQRKIAHLIYMRKFLRDALRYKAEGNKRMVHVYQVCALESFFKSLGLYEESKQKMDVCYVD